MVYVTKAGEKTSIAKRQVRGIKIWQYEMKFETIKLQLLIKLKLLQVRIRTFSSFILFNWKSLD